MTIDELIEYLKLRRITHGGNADVLIYDKDTNAWEELVDVQSGRSADNRRFENDTIRLI